MNWDKIRSQDFVIKILKSHIEGARIAPTYLGTGNASSGKEDLALAFAAAVNCEKKAVFTACPCNSCVKIDHGTHPDVRVLGADDAKSVKIEEVRDVLGWANLKPYEGTWKVLIAPDAHRMTQAAANAMLKTLEEPPGQTIFCLLTESRSHLLETIQSRAFELRFKNMPEESGDQGLQEALKKVRGHHWDDWLAGFQTQDRNEVKQVLAEMMNYFRNQIKNKAERESREPNGKLDSHLGAFQATYRAREALESNANQKLVLSWLAMKLIRLFPS